MLLLFVFEKIKLIGFLERADSRLSTLNSFLLFIFRYRLSSSTSSENVKKKVKNPYSNCSWLRNRLTGNDRYWWRRGRTYQLLNKHYSKKLSWFSVDKLLPSIQSSNNQNNRSVGRVQNVSYKISLSKHTWADDPHHSLQTLLESIVNRWQPHLMKENQRNIQSSLDSILTTRTLQPVRMTYG